MHGMSGAQVLLESLGGLRDAGLTAFRWELSAKRIGLMFDDLSAGLAEPVEYAGPEPGELVFRGVVSVFMTVDPIQDALTVYEARIVEEAEDVIVVEIKFRPGGTLTVNCEGLELLK